MLFRSPSCSLGRELTSAPHSLSIHVVPRLSRYADKFLVFEEYTLPDGIKNHVAAAPFQALGSAGLIADLKIE